MEQHPGLGCPPFPASYEPMLIYANLSTFHSTIQLWNSLPPINKVSPPPVQHRDLQPNLMASMGHLRSNQPNGSPDALNMFLPIKRRQHQVPDPKRKIVGQLGTKQIHPVTHKPLHRKMKEKLVGKLRNPSLAHPSLIMKFQNLLDSILAVCYDDIIRIVHNLKESRLTAFVSFLIPPYQIPVGVSPFDRLIPHLSIAQRSILGIILPSRFGQSLNLLHQGTGLICCDRKAPSLLFTKLHHLPAIKRRITSKMELLDPFGDFPFQPPEKSRSSRSRMRITRTKLAVNHLIRLMDKSIQRLKRIDAVIAFRRPLFLLPVNFVHLRIHIDRPTGYLWTMLINPLFNICKCPIQLQQMPQRKPTAEIPCSRRIGKILSPYDPSESLHPHEAPPDPPNNRLPQRHWPPMPEYAPTPDSPTPAV